MNKQLNSIMFSSKGQKNSLPGGLEPPTFRLTAERAAYCATEARMRGCVLTEMCSLLALLRLPAANRAAISIRPFSLSPFSNKTMSDLEKLLIKYMNVDSTTGNEREFGNLVAKDLENSGWNVVKQPLKSNPQRMNVLATRGNGKPRLMFNTHLDTVAPYIPPSEDKYNIYGRGSNDAKGQLACMISAANEIVSSDPSLASQIGLLFVVGEEVDHVGMIEANELFDGSLEYLVVGEPTELKFATIQKGAFKVLLKTKGIAGHSGYPTSGESAVHKLVPILNDVLSHKWPSDKTYGDTTVNIGFIKGGQAQNAWAAEAEANIFVRVTTSVDDVRQQLKSIVAGRCDLEELSSNDPVILDGSPLDQMPEDQVAFNTDLPYYKHLNSLKAKFLFGAGSIKNAHSEHEFMPKEELQIGKDSLVELVKKLLH